MSRAIAAAIALSGALLLVGCGSSPVLYEETEPSGWVALSGVSGDRLGIFRYEFVGGATSDLTPSAVFNASGLAVSPDGARIAFHDSSVSGGDGWDTDIYVMDADGTDLTRLTEYPGRDAHPAWSPDGTRIVFEREHSSDEHRLYVIGVDGAGEIALTDFPGNHWQPAWSPDGTQIVFVVQRESLPETDPDSCNSDIWVINADGTDPRQLTSSDGSSDAPQWSPGGTHVAFGHIPAGHDGSFVYIMNADGTSQKRLTADHLGGTNPSWSPGGGFLMFDSLHRIYLIRADGTDLHLLEHTVRQGQEPHWSPA